MLTVASGFGAVGSGFVGVGVLSLPDFEQAATATTIIAIINEIPKMYFFMLNGLNVYRDYGGICAMVALPQINFNIYDIRINALCELQRAIPTKL